MSAGLRLEGSMIARSVKRMFDERGEPRDAAGVSGILEWRGKAMIVGLVNVSPSGAIVICDEVPHIGETVTLQLADHAPVASAVRWVRDGRIGIHFIAPLK